MSPTEANRPRRQEIFYRRCRRRNPPASRAVRVESQGGAHQALAGESRLRAHQGNGRRREPGRRWLSAGVAQLFFFRRVVVHLTGVVAGRSAASERRRRNPRFPHDPQDKKHKHAKCDKSQKFSHVSLLNTIWFTDAATVPLSLSWRRELFVSSQLSCAFRNMGLFFRPYRLQRERS